MSLAEIGDLATVGALFILVYVTAKPAVNRWATVTFLRAFYRSLSTTFLLALWMTCHGNGDSRFCGEDSGSASTSS